MPSLRLLLLLALLNLSVHASVPAPVTDAIARIESRLRAPVIPDRTLVLTEQAGFSPDTTGTHDFRAATQAALDLLATQGGGTLSLTHPAGRTAWVKPVVVYRFSGFIEIPSNTRLLLDPAIRLSFQCQPDNYTRDGTSVLTRYEGTTVYGHAPLLRAFAAHDIIIAAAGGNGAMPEITGDGEAWLAWQDKVSPGTSDTVRSANNAGLPLPERLSPEPGIYRRRPSMLQFFLCRDILVEGIKFTNAPFWVVHPVFSERLVFRGLLFDCQNVNNDGIDVDSSRDVLIENVMFNNHDDNVVLKSGRDREGREGVSVAGTELVSLAASLNSPYLRDGHLGGPTEDVIVRRNVFKGHYALAVGSEMSGDVRRLYAVDNLAVQPVANLIFVKSSRARGGIVEGLHIHGLRVAAVRSEAIALIPNYDGDTTSPYVPIFRNIHITDLQVDSAGQGLRFLAWPEQPITGVTLERVAITLRNPNAKRAFDVSGVEHLRLHDVTIDGQSHDGDYTVPATSAPPRRN
jgi:polygalacturonase